MPREAYSTVYDIAADQHGYVTARQADEAGVRKMALVMMERRGVMERVSRGVYRLVHFPIGPAAEYIEAVLWPATAVGTLSHDSALALFEVSDVNPGRIHITVPRNLRIRRVTPPRLAVHHADIPDEDRDVFDGIPVTKLARTLRDCRAAGLGDEVLGRALLDAERQGLVNRREAEQLREELQLPRE
jgi:predicted transcriptional regulator of viral defense system